REGASSSDGRAQQALDALDRIGAPAADPLLDALEAARGRGVALANYRKALLGAVERLGRRANTPTNVQRVRNFRNQNVEVFAEVRQAAAQAQAAMEK